MPSPTKYKANRFSVKDFNMKYPNDDVILNEIFKKKFGNISDFNKYYKVNDRKCYAHSETGKQIHPLAGTIFHKSSTSLKLWYYAIFLFAASKNGVSAKELERQLGVTYKTAFRIAQQIRKLFNDSNTNLKGTVEMDEAYMGGKEQNKHESKKAGHKGTQGKTAVLGAVERGGEVVARVVDDTTSSSVTPFIRGKIEIGSTLNTDEYSSYENVKYLGYDHKQVNHSAKEYVREQSHTNTIEGFWSQLKRSIDGTYHMVSPKYLQSYVNEFAWRYNRRRSKTPMFLAALKGV
jgi:transposase